MLTPDVIAQLTAHFGADGQAKQLKAQGYRTIKEALGEIGISYGALSGRLHAIRPEENYLSDGLSPERRAEEKTLKGSMLVWKHPGNYRIVLLHPDYVQGQKEMEQKARDLKKQGYKSYEETVALSGLSYNTVVIRARKPRSGSALPAGRRQTQGGRRKNRRCPAPKYAGSIPTIIRMCCCTRRSSRHL
ncbi:MAG: hypothetical protein WDN72_09250 [Alphaproteobacteria bacterium]